MSKSASQKMKMLELLNVLMTESDENHPLGMQEILNALADKEIKAERKSVYSDIDQLNEMGYDIIYEHGRGYYIGARDFELVEVKLLSDTVQAARFLSAKKKKVLIDKLGRLCSRHQAKQLHKTLNFAKGSYFENESVYYILDTIYTAIENNREINFLYFHYEGNKEKKYLHDKKRYVVSPLDLVWDDERYYLIAYDGTEGFKHERTFRLDFMEDCKVGEVNSDEARAFKKAFQLDSFTESVFGMYSGKVIGVTLKFGPQMTHPIVDRFGKDVMLVKQSDGEYTIHVNVALSPQFYGWLVGLSDVQLVGPDEAIEGLKEHIGKFLK